MSYRCEKCVRGWGSCCPDDSDEVMAELKQRKMSEALANPEKILRDFILLYGRDVWGGNAHLIAALDILMKNQARAEKEDLNSLLEM